MALRARVPAVAPPQDWPASTPHTARSHPCELGAGRKVTLPVISFQPNLPRVPKITSVAEAPAKTTRLGDWRRRIVHRTADDARRSADRTSGQDAWSIAGLGAAVRKGGLEYEASIVVECAVAGARPEQSAVGPASPRRS